MSDKTKIEWTDATWNPVTGCTRVSPGCENCYIDWAPPFRIEGRHFVDGSGERSHAIGSTTGVRLHAERLDRPLRWRKPRRIFVNSLSDLFHDEIPDEFIARVFAVMALAPRHTFQVLTKRHGRMRSLLNSGEFHAEICRQVMDLLPETPLETRAMIKARQRRFLPVFAWPLPNVWLGVTVEDQKHADIRIPALLDTPATVRFLSCEPLLGPVDLRQWARCPCEECSDPNYALHWVIVGGESGKDARPMHPDWSRSLRDQCVAAGIPFFFKQWGDWGPLKALGKKAAGRELDGRTWDEYPQAVPL